MTEPEYCNYQVYRATLETPAEYCPNEAEPGEEYCLEHMPFDWDDDEDLDWVFEFEGDYE